MIFLVQEIEPSKHFFSVLLKLLISKFINRKKKLFFIRKQMGLDFHGQICWEW